MRRSRWWEEAEEVWTRQKDHLVSDPWGGRDFIFLRKRKETRWITFRWEKSVPIWIDVPSMIMYHFPLIYFKISFFLSLVFSNLIMVCLGRDLHGFILFDILGSVGFYLWSDLGIFSNYSFKCTHYPCTLSFFLSRRIFVVWFCSVLFVCYPVANLKPVSAL